ncbi:MAG: putative metal-dependent hydrolase YcfH [Candidatus Anoxychlamydiales bacterium]|nr:putative metal-dependent hydrolase YcfH [Candidatus Anoxychlamydiales bacterium]NGX40668.1 putative metal-dependent hydrolase YcfH [Candidatus Anoxychlamydiales bacterium]HEU64851.1 TatD family deoxyribonuclease [Chlamydiota bacterium]
MEFFDSHAHLTGEGDFENLDEIIKRAKDANVTKIMNICTDLGSLDRGLELSKKYDFVFTAASTTPHGADNDKDIFFEDVKKSVANKQLIAVGETGLDYFYGLDKKEFQKLFFKNYLKLAKENDLPLIIHARDAFEDIFRVADEIEHSRAVLHCFTGIEKEAKKVLDRGWLISFSGIVTFKNSQYLREIVKTIPIESILIETDSPLLAPQSKRGKKNEPANIVETAQVIADIKNKSLDEIAKITFDNANKFFFS